MRDRADWLELAKENRTEQAAPLRPQLEMAQREAVTAKELTGHPAWDKYLTYVQARIEETEHLLRDFEEKLIASDVVEYTELLKAKMGARECVAIIKAWKTAISLPKDWIKAGERAVSILDRISKNED